MKAKVLGTVLALSLVAAPLAAAPLSVDAAAATAVTATAKAQTVLPDSFTLKFVNGSKVLKEVTVAAAGWGSYEEISIPDASGILVWDEDGELVRASQWEADCIDLTVGKDDYLSGQTLDLDYSWTEKNPTIIFTAASAEPAAAAYARSVEAQTVLPDSFTLKFVNGNKVLHEVTVAAEGWGAYNAIDIPSVPGILVWGEDGELVRASQWKADCIDLTVKKGDYLSGQSLDLDYSWTDVNPVIIFEAAE